MNNETKKDTILNEFVKRTGRAPTPAEEDLLNMMGTQVSATDYLDKVAKAAMSEVEVKPQEKELTELERKKLEEYEATGKKFKQEDKDRKIAEESKIKIKALEAEKDKDIKKWAEGFYGETPEHLRIRNRLYEITKEKDRAIPKKKEELEKERLGLLTEYIKLHYEIGTKTFNKVLVYRSISKDIELRSEDNGRTWTILEYMNGQWVHGNFKLILKDGKPYRLSTLLENMTLYDFMRSGILADFIIKYREE